MLWILIAGNIDDGEIDCIMHKISDQAKSECGCQPWYANAVSGHQCDTLSLFRNAQMAPMASTCVAILNLLILDQ